MPNAAVPESHYADLPNGRIRYHEAGSGPAVIFIHGGGPGAYGFSNFSKNMQALADRGFRSIVYDHPGFGESEHRNIKGGMFDAMAEALLELMDYLELDKASLVGNSLGGGTALVLALDHPERVDKLILMGPGGGMPVHSTFPTEGIMRMATFYDGDGPSIEKVDRVVDLLVYDRSDITPDLIEKRFEAATRPEIVAAPPLAGQVGNTANDLWRRDLESLPHETLIIWGAEDRVLPVDMAFQFQRRIPEADLHIYSKCGHWAQWEKAEEFNSLVADFISNG
ncbi:alpha/beta fold hydrolase [Henriciella aquimarina]|uniref:alpha/beta fold hydrolase n=1 Tax=Henriciella aquimarina TaxID=545261 RepID=UPI000A009C40|nr:alpha/beta fold hydrolase [Henriciella aquimarina]